MSPRRSLAALAILIAACQVFVCSCGRQSQRAPADIKAAETAPMRIVSLSPGTTEMLYALGLGDRVVGVTGQCDYPPEARRKPSVGDVSTSVESVVQARPDVVVAHAFLNREAVRALRALGVRVVAVDPSTLEGVADAVREISVVCGVSARGETVAEGIRRAVRSVGRSPRPSGVRVKVLFAAQGSPLWAAGADTFVDEMISMCGGANVSRDIGSGSFNLFSEESAIASDPDVIFVTDGVSRKHFLHAPGWRNTAAVLGSRVVLVDPDIYLRPGPRLVEGLKQMSDILASIGSGH